MPSVSSILHTDFSAEVDLENSSARLLCINSMFWCFMWACNCPFWTFAMQSICTNVQNELILFLHPRLNLSEDICKVRLDSLSLL